MGACGWRSTNRGCYSALSSGRRARRGSGASCFLIATAPCTGHCTLPYSRVCGSKNHEEIGPRDPRVEIPRRRPGFGAALGAKEEAAYHTKWERIFMIIRSQCSDMSSRETTY